MIQDPVWEQSFPPIGGVVVPFWDPRKRRVMPVRLSAAEAAARSEQNQHRYTELLESLRAYDLEPVVLGSDERTGDLPLLPRVGRPAPLLAGEELVKGRLPFLVALVLAIVGGTAALVLLVRDEKPTRVGFPVGDDGIAARSSLSSRTQLFGSPVRARLDLLVDRTVLDPDRVAVDAKFEPFDLVAAPTKSRTDYDRYTRLRFDYELECLKTICVPDTLTKPFDLSDTVVRHDGLPVEIVEWPSITVASRFEEPVVDRNDPTAQPGFDLPWRATLRLQPATFRVDPTLLAAGLAGLGLVLLVASLFFVQKAFPGVPLGFHRLRRVKLTPLERALVVLERAHERGIEREQRLALDRLAQELRTGGQQQLAGTARRLAWEEDAPDSERTATLSDQVRDVIAGRSNGRS